MSTKNCMKKPEKTETPLKLKLHPNLLPQGLHSVADTQLCRLHAHLSCVLRVLRNLSIELQIAVSIRSRSSNFEATESLQADCRMLSASTPPRLLNACQMIVGA